MKPKPSTGFEIERIPLAMFDAPRWVNWRAVERDDKWTKIPCDSNRKSVDATDPENGRTFNACTDAATALEEFGSRRGERQPGARARVHNGPVPRPARVSRDHGAEAAAETRSTEWIGRDTLGWAVAFSCEAP